MDVPDGGHTTVNPDGSATVYDKDGNAIGQVARPWAFDSAGRPQKTWYAVDENGDLVQHVEPAENALYPILADPALVPAAPGSEIPWGPDHPDWDPEYDLGRPTVDPNAPSSGLPAEGVGPGPQSGSALGVGDGGAGVLEDNWSPQDQGQGTQQYDPAPEQEQQQPWVPPAQEDPPAQLMDAKFKDSDGNEWTRKDGQQNWEMERDGRKWTKIPREGGRYRLEVRDKNGRLIQFGEFARDGSGKGRMIGEDGKWHDAYFRPDGSIFLPGEWTQGSGDFQSHFETKIDVTILPDGTRVVDWIMRDPDRDDAVVGRRKAEVNPDGSFRRYWSNDIDGDLQERPINQIDSGMFTDALWWFMPIPGAGLAMKGASKLAGKIPGLNKAIPKIAEKLPIPKPRQAPLGTAPVPMPKHVPGVDPDPLPPPGGIPGVHPTPKAPAAPNPHLHSGPGAPAAPGNAAGALDAGQQQTLADALRPDKMDHVFVPKHKLDSVVARSGGEEAAMREIVRSIQGPDLPTRGPFEVERAIHGEMVVIRGAVVNGIPRIGTVFIR
ncbi:hypothetical protein nbrc107696_19520 [Gordonia spumicola]|uniref:Uncharacterized protein n=2 Tax=Gordonia spumicola TaxID=589161 RepID=A0A7I9V7Z1_9ACTN|nr:hypothetical protein nbrc107696_19520 [Gordonia spumicola]